MTVRRALANSKNIPALYLTSLLGPDSVLESFKRVGLTRTGESGQHFGLGIAIGNLETNLWSLVQGYSVLANQGRLHELQIRKEQRREPGYQIIDPETVSLITSVLTDHQSRSDEFGRGGYLELDHPVAVKTGTSNDYRDTWILSYSPDYTVGMWRGNASGAATEGQAPAAKSLGPLLKVVWDHLYRYQEPKGFQIAKGLVKKKVCPLSGMLVGDSCPGGRHEWFRAGSEPTEKCKWHRHVTVDNCSGETRQIHFVDLPSEYKEWVRSSDLPSLGQQHQELCGGEPEGLVEKQREGPRILEPLDDSVYALDPTIPRANQMLKVIHRGAQSKKLKLVLDNELYKTIRSDSEDVFLPLEKGRHTLYLEDPEGIRSPAVRYMVK
ncbi:MAG: penicillin-binding transpeptidase domain-containing protein, partial [Pseudomonadota bacterium]